MPADFSDAQDRPGAAAARCLFFGEDDGAVRLAGFAELHRDGIR